MGVAWGEKEARGDRTPGSMKGTEESRAGEARKLCLE